MSALHFRYQVALIRSAETGDPTLILRPEIPVRFTGPQGEIVVDGLVDTGADDTIVAMSVARACGISLFPGRGPEVQAVGGQKFATLFGDIRLQLNDGQTQIEWTARVQFFDFPDQADTVLLGHAGFLDYFTATFTGADGQLTLVPNADLPVGGP